MEWEQITGITGSVAVVGALGRLIWYVESEVIRSLRERVDDVEELLRQEREGRRADIAERDARIRLLEGELRSAWEDSHSWRRRHNRLDDLRRGVPPPDDQGGRRDR